MDSRMPDMTDLKDLSIDRLGIPKILSPLRKSKHVFTDDFEKVLVDPTVRVNQGQTGRPNVNSSERGLTKVPPALSSKTIFLPAFEVAGSRERIFFNPKHLTCGIVTCGGLCPGLNDVIRTVTLSLIWQYGVKKVLGFRYGYRGISQNPQMAPLDLNPDSVNEIHLKGGTVIGTSRGNPSPAEMVDTLVRHNVRILFAIGGDGTLRGAHDLVREITRRKKAIAVIGIPKTIDNDIYCVQQSFGFSTAVEESRKAIAAAHHEAKSACNGVGLVKLMGRDSGFIAAHATMANSDVNFCLVPEVPFQLTGPSGFLGRLEKRLKRKQHAVIVVAEGVGQNFMPGDSHGDIGLFLKARIEAHFKSKNISMTLKYIDPSYMIRSCPADANDAAFCLMLGQFAVHAGMSGRTDMVVSYWNNRFVHVPLSVVTLKRKYLDPQSELWQTLIETTGQLDSR